MLKLKVTVDHKQLKKLIDKEIEKELPAISEEIVAELANATPKDTGLAASSWEVTDINYSENSFRIFNNQDYMKYLNAGSSKQAPRFFIEQVALNYGEAKGSIVSYED